VTPRRGVGRARRRGGRLGWFVFFVVLAVLLGGAWLGRHQIIALLAPQRVAHHVAVVPSEEPSVEATVAPPTPSSTASALPGPSPSATPSAGPRVAIIIDDCGYSMERDSAFLTLPIPITLSVLPITPHGAEIAQAALSAGKYAIVHLPMQPDSAAANPGPGAITTDMSDDQVRSQVNDDLNALPALPGANNHMGSRATSDKRVMNDVIGVFKDRHMFFIDSMTSPLSVGAATARAMDVPSASRAVFLDNQATVPYVEGQLRATMTRALKYGTAIAIGHPNPQTDQALAEMIPQMKAAGIVFVPAQSLVQ
jgi:polysaccharide deacetylase 2 family uncharacterized protein YibQ